ncbi:hypothetical protein WAI453_008606 [Rhynchosporium graminicola]
MGESDSIWAPGGQHTHAPTCSFSLRIQSLSNPSPSPKTVKVIGSGDTHQPTSQLPVTVSVCVVFCKFKESYL